ncbi:MAG TPA: hypothetical protein VFH43_08615 [Candidatus Kapabacteria bacterium]|nr:hypothetical protein [Candidatus Kapabacteria bacterium]
MIDFDVRELDRSILLTIFGMDVKAASAVLGKRQRMQSETLPKVQIEVGDKMDVRFYPDLIKISFNPDEAFDEPIAQFQTLKFDELMGKDEPIVVKKSDERAARLERVRTALELFTQELHAQMRSAS